MTFSSGLRILAKRTSVINRAIQALYKIIQLLYKKEKSERVYLTLSDFFFLCATFFCASPSFVWPASWLALFEKAEVYATVVPVVDETWMFVEVIVLAMLKDKQSVVGKQRQCGVRNIL